MTTMTTELKGAVRRLYRAPAFTTLAVLTLALGIGANSAMFSIVNAILLEPLPYAEPDQLVRIWGTSDRVEKGNVNPLDALDWREGLDSFESLSVFHASEVTLRRDQTSLRIPNARVTSEYFDTLGVQPLFGTGFTREHEEEGNDQVALLSHELWESLFAKDPGVVGRTLELSDTQFEIIGVMPPGYRDPLESWVGPPMLWRPMVIDPGTQGRGGHFMQVFARLAPGTSLSEAQAELDALMGRLGKLYPDTNTGKGTRIESLRATMVEDSRTILVLLMGAVAVVLLIGCVNVANLFFARGAARSRELAIRSSMGASRIALARMTIAESLLIATAGAALALGVCQLMMKMIGSLVEARLLVRNPIELDASVLLFTAAVAAGSALICGLLPAIHASGTRAFGKMQETGRSGGVGRRARRVMRLLVVSQIALSAIVLVAALLMVRSLQHLTAVDPGFDPERVVAVNLRLAPAAYPEDPQIFAFHEELRERLLSRRNIDEVALTNILPFGDGHSCDGYLIEGDADIPGMGPCAETRSVSPRYFAAMGIPILQGRAFGPEDEHPERPGIVISRSMATNFQGDPIGQKVRLSITGEPWATVIGIAGDVRHASLREQPPETLYMPFAVNPYYSVVLAIRTSAEDAVGIIPDVRTTIQSIDPTIPLNRIDPLEHLVSSSLGTDRLRTGLLGGFGLLALLLAVSGTYGLFSFLVASGRRDTGVRMALGADGLRLSAELLRDVVALSLAGIAIGLISSVGASRLVESFLHGIPASDPLTYCAVAATLLLASIAAAALPMGRAIRIDPVDALRAE